MLPSSQSQGRANHYVSLQMHDSDEEEVDQHASRNPSARSTTEDSTQPVFVSALPLPASTSSAAVPGETWTQTAWRLLVETANPRTTHTEDLTPAERLKQASFESFDYYKSYPAMYLKYLREKRRGTQIGLAGSRRASNAAISSGYHNHEDFNGGRNDEEDDEEDEEEIAGARASSALGAASGLQPSPAVASGGLRASLPATVSAMSSLTQVSLPLDEDDRHTPLRWFLHVLIALSVGVVATVVSYAVDIMESYRAETLSRVIAGSPFRVIGYALGFAVWLLMSVGLVAIATGVVVCFEPAASGGGIPDVMAYLNGVHMTKAMNIKTFIAKAISCVCAVAGGLPVGLEAPLIHLGSITGAGVTQGRSRTLGFQTPFFQAFRNNKDRRDFITAGAACGVSAAFGAPIGGLLFVMEEVSSFWDHSSSGQIFLATMICFVVTTVINSLVEDNRLLGWVSNAASVLFEVNLTIPLNLVSIVPSLFLGAILGGLAALFTKANLIMIKWRREVLRPYPLRRFLEPVLVAAVYSTLMYTLSLLSDCRSLKSIEDIGDTAHVWGTEGSGRLFNDTCPKANEYSPLGTLNMATGKNTIRHLFTRQTVGEFPVYYLVIHFVLYFVFACVSSGMALSGGLVVPSLVIGAIFGRLFGLLLWYMGAHRGVEPGMDRSYRVIDAWMDPGVFALIGAGAFLAGTSRMAMSICVIMVELSSELHYLLPVMAAIVMSKTVADWLCEPLYHEMLHLDSVPYLSATLARPEFEQLTAADVMATPVVVLRRREQTEVVLRALRDTTHHAFPVVVEVAGDEAEQQRELSSSTPWEEAGEQTSRVHSPSRIRGLDGTSPTFPSASTGSVRHRHALQQQPPRNTHFKFVGLVTREDLQVYFTLPQLRNYEPSVEAALAQQVSQRYGSATAADYDDGFGGRLAQCVVDINRMTWTQWLVHKTSLFLMTGDRYDWVRRNIPVGAASRPTTTPEAAQLGDGKTAEGEDSTDSNHGRGPATTAAAAAAGDGAASDVPLLPPVLDLSLIINRSPWVIPPSFNLQMAYHTFRTMGLRHMVVVDGDVVRGIITRKDLLVDSLRRRLKELRARIDNREGPANAGRTANTAQDTATRLHGSGRDTAIRGAAFHSPVPRPPPLSGAAASSNPLPGLMNNRNEDNNSSGSSLVGGRVRGPGAARSGPISLTARAEAAPSQQPPPAPTATSLLWED